MQFSRGCCPHCLNKFYFPVEGVAEQFLIICTRCRVGYNLVKVEVEEGSLGRLLFSKSIAPFGQKLKSSKALFQYLRSVATDFRFTAPVQPNAIIFQVAHMRAPFPLAVYFHNKYYKIRSFNGQVLSALLTIPGTLILLAIGFSLLSVMVGLVLGILCFSQFVNLPKIKGTTRNRLVAEQMLLKQGYELQQAFERVLEIRLTHQNLLKRQRTVLEQISQTPIHYKSGIDPYQRAMKCIDDYLNLCDYAIRQYQLAIRSIAVQVETSKLSVELPDRFINPHLEFGLNRLEEQLIRNIPPSFSDYEPNNN